MGIFKANLNQRILAIADGDEDFALQLCLAIKEGLEELQAIYTKGQKNQSDLEFQQIRHKLKPTLIMFEFDALVDELAYGVDILEKDGFGLKFDEHFISFNELLKVEIEKVNMLITS